MHQENNHELNGEIQQIDEANQDVESYSRDLVRTIRSFEAEEDATVHISHSFDMISDKMNIIRENCKSALDRINSVASTHFFQLEVMEFLKKMADNVDEYIKEKGNKDVAEMAEQLQYGNAVKITLPEPYYISKDGNTKYTDIWFIEPTGAVFQNSQVARKIVSLTQKVYSIFTDIDSLFDNYHDVIKLCCETGLVKTQDGSPFTSTTLANIKTDTMFFFLSLFSMCFKNGNFSYMKERLREKTVIK